VDRDDEPIAELAERAAGGDRDAFRRLVEITAPTVFRVALRKVGNRDDADDIAQETFVRAWQSLGKLRDHGATLGWLCRIASNVASDLHRARGRRARRSIQEVSVDGSTLLERLRSDEPDPARRLEDAELARAAMALVAELKEKYRIVLLLREVDGMSYEEIGAALAIPVGTVESRLHRARTALARKLERLEAIHQREVNR
jgi:RNA polymerase sigma-70 factor (ECF subfamily)